MKKSSAPFKSVFPFKRKKDTHKGDYGKIAIIGGSYGMAGAVILAANSCMKSGAGLTYVFIPESIYPIVASGSICSVMFPVKEDSGKFRKDSAPEIIKFCNEKADTVCIGPGMGRSKQLSTLVNQLTMKITKPLIIDADGLNNLNTRLLLKRRSPTILTPHRGEFTRLAKSKTRITSRNRNKIAIEFAKYHKVILVLKGYKTIVTDGKRTFINSSGNPGMATGGSGDSLAGIIPAFCAVMNSSYEAICLSVYLHGLAGDIASKKLTETCLTAEDIVNHIPEAMKNVERRA